MSHKLRYLVLALLIIGSLFVRLYRIGATQTFLEDEGRDMLMVKRMLDTKLPVLLGPQTSTGNMYLGPIYYYFITPSLILSQGHPVGPAIFIGLTGVITVALLFFLGKRYFGERAGLVASALYAFLPYPVSFTRNSWNPNLVPLIMLLLLYLAIEINIKKGNVPKKQLFTFGILAGILIQLHYMALVGLGALGLYIIVTNYNKIKELFISFIFGIFGFLLPMIPFVLFELRNNFINSRALIGFVSGSTDDNLSFKQTFSSYIQNIKDTYLDLISGQFGIQTFTVDASRYLLGFVFLLVLGYSIYSRTNNKAQKLVSWVFVVSMLVLGLYQEQIHLHYLGFLLPVVYLIVASLADKSKVRYIVAFLVLAIIGYTSQTLYIYLHSGPTFQVEKAQAVANYIGIQAQEGVYNVVSSQLGQTSPYQYFLSRLKNPPSNTLQQKLFVICDGAPCHPDEETTTLIYLTGPSHPSLTDYLGHPQLNEFRGERRIISNEHITNGVWVAELIVNTE